MIRAITFNVIITYRETDGQTSVWFAMTPSVRYSACHAWSVVIAGQNKQYV